MALRFLLATLGLSGVLLALGPVVQPATAAPAPRPVAVVTAIVSPETGAVIQVPEIASTITVPPEATEFVTTFTFSAWYNEDMPGERGPERLPPGVTPPNKYLLIGSRVWTVTAVDIENRPVPFFLNPVIIDTRITDRDIALAQDIALNITLGRFEPSGRRWWELEASQADTQAKTMRSYVSRPGVMAILIKNVGVLPAPNVLVPNLPPGFPFLPLTGQGADPAAQATRRGLGIALLVMASVPAALLLGRLRRLVASD